MSQGRVRISSQWPVIVALAAVLALVPVASSAAPVTFFGQDAGLGDETFLTVAFPNAQTAQNNFLAALLSPGVETFESLGPASSPVDIAFSNGITATLSGAAGEVRSLSDGVASAKGRYGVTGDADADEKYWHADEAFSITFSQPVSAFGFFGTDVGDFDGQLTVTTSGGLNQMFVVPHAINGPGGGVLFWGIFDPTASFTKIIFGNTKPGVDTFGFDDFTVATANQVIDPVPEPTSMLLLGTGLAAAAYRRRRARRE